MKEDKDIPKLSGYVSVKEAAEMLNVSDKMIYFYIDHKRLNAVRASNLLLIPTEELENFKQKSVGRPRTRTPAWRISSKDNALFVTSISVQIEAGQQDVLLKKLSAIRRKAAHEFPGTVARYIINYETTPNAIEILLIWKMGTMPDEVSREQALEAFRQELAEVLDWQSAQYKHGNAILHS
ncbi:DNA-binding protein [Ktedonosporobacter rubrisoli]|uniref:DNA-binding protein n=1 Tax=Ktedonosporobacter rubrisoli TaxID=2509675 RepID=A0A4P6JYM1_KTERU|nr:helix-turn-helix domain-containing protein [Ktedonosporobacter rubrisoli]QBD80804.1 DNA-binding protein [Ktedonosporobacter rubrisoli]